MLWPKPPAIKALFALNIKENKLRGKVTPHNDGARTSSEHAGEQSPTQSGKSDCGGLERDQRKPDKTVAHERRQRVIYVSCERSGNWK